MTPLSLAYSPCPNDTFIFYALTHGCLAVPQVTVAPPILDDVETLNEWAMAGRFDVTKLSFHALGLVLDEYCLLSAGSALGRGCGPLLVAKRQLASDELSRCRVAIPGRLTTAALLFRLFCPECVELVPMRFDLIMAAVHAGEVDAGVIIHESRFTYADFGLTCLQDLGSWWEQSSGLPIPLGCIAARRSLGVDRIHAIERAIRASVDWAHANPAVCLPYIRKHAQEIDEQVMQNHIGLYVNDFSRDLGDKGLAAIQTFLQRGRQAGILPESDQDLLVTQ
ncbi:MAG: 1,4-dihydroxy-6-naphthoate synthase [Desulfobulbaceae bacterium]|uniref:1,4-dihydroxy-6-naphtoate synthase n=1 Tax=Candidatus Desulfatifera sulfidica TaxID=2841691 RepID=A0A8J6TE29_9BACT|nr:1,4-dihydroxy-6-naphthoate synthase [Candidatus Desulfatifera sulfidica]